MTDPIFVFGSNLAGRHGKGAALYARRHRGAIYGNGHGLQGSSYAIPTKGYEMEVLILAEIEAYVVRFLAFARENPGMTFEVTAIGTGYAGYTPNQIAPFFKDAPMNCHLPVEFQLVNGGK